MNILQNGHIIYIYKMAFLHIYTRILCIYLYAYYVNIQNDKMAIKSESECIICLQGGEDSCLKMP